MNKLCRPPAPLKVFHLIPPSCGGWEDHHKRTRCLPQPASVCLPDVPQFVFHLLTRTSFYFYFCFFLFFLALHFTPMRKEGTSGFFCWGRGGRSGWNPTLFHFALEKLVEIEGFGWREADRVHRRPPPSPRPPPPAPGLMETAILSRPEAGTYKHGLH